MRRLSCTTLLLALCAAPAFGQDRLQGRTFHFGTHPARTNITFVSEADLETIHGVTHTVRGSVTVDAAGTKASATLRVPVASMRTGIDLRDEHLRSDAWLDAARFPTIALEIVSATEGEDGRTWDYAGRLTIKGVTRELKGRARVTAFPDEVAAALGAGSWLRLRTDFQVKLSDFGITIPAQVGPKVSQVWAVGVDLYGTTAAPTAR